jgi:peroxiredoxin
VSTDTPAELEKGRGKHGLQATMLSDPELAVTDLFGLRNKGPHSGIPGGVKALPVPTSLLVDAQGQVLWMDQSENYQRRSDPDHVLGALRAHLDHTPL